MSLQLSAYDLNFFCTDKQEYSDILLQVAHGPMFMSSMQGIQRMQFFNALGYKVMQQLQSWVPSIFIALKPYQVVHIYKISLW